MTKFSGIIYYLFFVININWKTLNKVFPVFLFEKGY